MKPWEDDLRPWVLLLSFMRFTRVIEDDYLLASLTCRLKYLLLRRLILSPSFFMCFNHSARRRLSLSQPDLQTKYLLHHRLISSPGKMISAPGASLVEADISLGQSGATALVFCPGFL
ncbi:hypothetical protein CDAR_423491 [Caerostris darwini]|uniref:Uncharacterized protein n=1 Tax=Caerostris darwini TaxID=1538125 RepID=A0AAV4U254_9ARAC|nr:hypothetical protein CDAR_423491 [Caerostris darwini]